MICICSEFMPRKLFDNKPARVRLDVLAERLSSRVDTDRARQARVSVVKKEIGTNQQSENKTFTFDNANECVRNCILG